MTDLEALHRAVLEHPDDDTPRLVYADWLEEHGDPRGEFIRVQCELARMGYDDPRRPDFEKRQRELAKKRKKEEKLKRKAEGKPGDASPGDEPEASDVDAPPAAPAGGEAAD